MNATKIEWADFTWSPIVGCKNGCPYCYARRLATTRLAHLCPQCATFTPHLHPERLDQPLHVWNPALIFADSMSDWWSDGVDPIWRYSAISAMRVAFGGYGAGARSRFVVLTKRPECILPEEVERWPSNAWLGVSITSGEDWWRWEALAKLPERIQKFISVEPLLGPGVGASLLGAVADKRVPAWVVLGPLSGPGEKPRVVEWQEVIRGCCQFAGIPLFEKSGLPIQPPIRQMPPDLAAVFRKGGLQP
jgi:protein gp37